MQLIMTPSEVAEALGVEPSTVSRWAKEGRIRSLKTLGGHRRYYREDVDRLQTWLATASRNQAPQGKGPDATSGT